MSESVILENLEGQDANTIWAGGKLRKVPCILCGNQGIRIFHDKIFEDTVIRFNCRKCNCNLYNEIPRQQRGEG